MKKSFYTVVLLICLGVLSQAEAGTVNCAVAGTTCNTASTISGQVAIANGGTGASTVDGAKISLGLPPNALAASFYRSGYGYIAGPRGASLTSTNTNVLAANTLYGTVGYIWAPVTITAVGFRTSSSNASSGASVKFCVYDMNTDGSIGSLLAKTTSGTTITDAATSAAVTGTLDAPVTLQAGPKLFAMMVSFTTTAPRAAIFGSTGLFGVDAGGAGPGVLGAFSTPDVGYTSSATYSSGCPSSFGTPTTVVVATNHPVLAFMVQ